jgi:hypothetical protein
MNPLERYEALAGKFSRTRGVTRITEGRGFGSSGQLKFGGRIFAMLVRGELVLKLPRPRVEELVRTGEGTFFDAGKGKPMREWFVLSAASKRQWLPLAQEAFDFAKEAK